MNNYAYFVGRNVEYIDGFTKRNDMKLEQSFELKKHVGAIHSSNHLTLIQRKIANALLYNAYDELLDKNEHQIHIKALCTLIGYDSKDSKAIKKALVALISTVIEWNLVDANRLNSEEIWNASAIIADASIDGPVCTYSYSNKMRQLLYRPELYGRLNMHVQSQFKSTYGLALYENCIRYQNIAQTPWFNMQTFRKLMGVEQGKYLVFRDFKRRVLDKAVSEVNKHAQISITVKFKKERKQVIAVKFLIKRSEQLLLENFNGDEKQKSLVERLHNDFAFSKMQVKQTLSSYEEYYILEKIMVVESSSTFQNGKIVNLAKYLENALKHDYKFPKSSKERISIIHQESERNRSLQKLKEKQTEQYRRYQDGNIMLLYKALPQMQKKQIANEFAEYIQNNVYHNLFLTDGLSNVLVADRFCDFVRRHRKDLLLSLVSFEEFCASGTALEKQG